MAIDGDMDGDGFLAENFDGDGCDAHCQLEPLPAGHARVLSEWRQRWMPRARALLVRARLALRGQQRGGRLD